MLASELIKELTKIIEKYGNREVTAIFVHQNYVRLGVRENKGDVHPIPQAVRIELEE